jgi:predicted ribosome quality control (RQC) complex YloA/Tae2 family protein
LSKDIVYRYGKNAIGNFTIIDMATPDDVWFHISNDSSAHVIACLPLEKLDKKQKHQIIKQGALLCKNISKYKNKKDVEIIYSKVRDIEKTETVGMVVVKNGKSIKI